VKRRLAAILAADAVGYSRLMGEAEEETLRILTAHRAVIDGIIRFHEGRIVGTAGDSVLAEFASSVEAVRCAVEIQEALATRNDALPEPRRLLFRIGVNLGDVMVKGDDLLGDGVNVAARLESIAEPGGICISRSVYDQITGKLNLGVVDIGEQTLKNIAKPVRVYRIAGTHAATPSRRVRRRGRGALWAAVGGLAAAVIVTGVVAWQAGWLAPGARDTASAQAQLAADRAAAEARLARERAESELARQRAEAAAAAAETRRALEAERAAALRARAEAELAQARAEAEAIKRRAEEEATRAAKAVPPAEVRSPALAPPAAPTLAAARFDGQWMVTRSCEPFQDLAAFVDRFPLTVTAGQFVLERGSPGKPGHWLMQGTPAVDGSLALTGTALGRGTGLGRQFPLRFQGRFDNDEFRLKGTIGARNCSLLIARSGG
jgi:class 3 adenylate cyclase